MSQSNPCARFKVSTETIPPKDPRAAAVADLSAKCHSICELANEVRDAQRAMFAAERELSAARTKDDATFTAAMAAYNSASVRFGSKRDELYNAKDVIESDLRRYNADLGFNIHVSHTEAGLPIRVNSVCKKELWD